MLSDRGDGRRRRKTSDREAETSAIAAIVKAAHEVGIYFFFWHDDVPFLAIWERQINQNGRSPLGLAAGNLRGQGAAQVWVGVGGGKGGGLLI